MFVKFVLLCVILFVSACASSLGKLRTAKFEGSEYNVALAEGYLNLSEKQADSYDWKASRFFARKGLKALKGKNVEPEKPSKWKVKSEYADILEQARRGLMGVIDAHLIKSNPREVADAQVLLDCWMENQGDIGKSDQVADCREDFYKAIDGLYSVRYSAVDLDPKGLSSQSKLGGDPASRFKVAARNTGEVIVPDDLLKRSVYFAFDKYSLNKESKKTIMEVGKHAKASKSKVVLNGHADRMGNAEYNMRLSKMRAASVRDELVRLGVSKDLIEIFAFGEHNSIIPTDDGVANRKNRVVNILLGQN